jgi:SAM-dependent methyltransferase
MSRVGEHVCYALSHFLLTRDLLGRYRSLARISERVEEFTAWRNGVLEKALGSLPPISLEGKTVLDFGCGGGELSRLLMARGAAKLYGVDLNPDALDDARRSNPNGASAEFLLGAESSIPLPSSSIDVIFCISVLEHVIDVDSILTEWHRILRPGGHVLIEWCAWHHPDGSHLDSVIPIPYAQCIFSESTLSRTARRIHNSPSYRPKFWDTNDKNGSAKEDSTSDHYTENFLNKMSVGQFNAKLARGGMFVVTHHQCHPPSWFPYVRPLLRIPFFREHCSSFVTYVLTKSA